ncbi:MAG: DUF805 domain-containing protein [Muribaculaceae bacterium]|nr:DUF805 domain-containing protein [Muribaculaceae bacterium]
MQYQVNFIQAIQLAFSNYVNFNGRASRSEFWWWVLFTFLVGLVCGVIGNQWLTSAVNLALLLPNLGLNVRRLHDIGKSGWWLFLGLLPIVGWIILIVWLCKPSDMQDNQYGPVPHCA